MPDARVELLQVAQAPRKLRERGMIAWLRVGVDRLVIDGVSLREGRDERGDEAREMWNRGGAVKGNEFAAHADVVERLLTTPEALKKLARAGRFPALLRINAKRYPARRDSLERWLESAVVGPKRPARAEVKS